MRTKSLEFKHLIGQLRLEDNHAVGLLSVVEKDDLK